VSSSATNPQQFIQTFNQQSCHKSFSTVTPLKTLNSAHLKPLIAPRGSQKSSRENLSGLHFTNLLLNNSQPCQNRDPNQELKGGRRLWTYLSQAERKVLVKKDLVVSRISNGR
jgi:hypothetical protein